MAKQIYRKVSYGLSEPLVNIGQEPIVSKKDPRASDRAQIGTEWINTATNNAFVITSVVDNLATWININSGSATNSFVADSGSASPVAGVIRISGSGIASTSASGNTVVINAPVTTYVSDAGTATPSSNTITFHGTGSVTTSASGSTITIGASGGGGGSGTPVQQARTSTSVASFSNTNIADASVTPTTSNTVFLMSLSFTPMSTTNTLIFESSVQMGGGGDSILCLFSGSTLITTSGVHTNGASGNPSTGLLYFEGLAGITSPTTYAIYYAAVASPPTTINQDGIGNNYGGTLTSFFTITEVIT